MTTDAAGGRWAVRAVVLIAGSLAVWAGCLRLFALHNDFPAAYHPDEGSKAEQLIEGVRNFNHPQLMLEAAPLVLPDPLPAGEDRVVRQARVVSAAFGAGAAVLLAWAGYAAAGRAGFLCVAIAVGLCPALLSHAHFFKEDAALVFGLAATLCAGAWAMRVRTPGPLVWALIALGVGVGLAASGKYCGVVLLLPAGVAAAGAPLARRQWALAAAGPVLVVSVAACVWAGVNWRVFTDYGNFLEGFDRERRHGVDGHRGITMRTPTGYFLDVVTDEAMPHVKLLAPLAIPAAAAAWAIRSRRRRAASRRPEDATAYAALDPRSSGPATNFFVALWLGVTVTTYLVMLAYSTIPFYRYALPVTVTLHTLAGLAAASITRLLPRGRWRVGGVAAAAGWIAVAQGSRCADYTGQFADDSRDAFRVWAWTAIPAGTAVAVAVDDYALAYAPDRPGPGPLWQHLRVVRGVEPGVDALRRAGVHYVVTASSHSERYLSPYVVPDNAFFRRVIDSYKDVRRYPAVFSRVAEHPMRSFANPDIVVYDITEPPR